MLYNFYNHILAKTLFENENIFVNTILNIDVNLLKRPVNNCPVYNCRHLFVDSMQYYTFT